MKGFKLSDGDLVITNDEISLIEDSELKAQTIKQVISTNKGEWLFDTEEGIDFDNIFQDRVPNMNRSSEISRQEYISLKQTENEMALLAKKLERRLDGEK